MEQIERKYFWLIIPYFLVTGTLYIWGYWSTFDINAFEYASINEAVIASFIPLASGLIFVLIGAAIGTFASQNEQPMEATSEQNKKKMSRMDWLILVGFFIPSVISFVVTDNIGSRWITCSILLSTIPAVAMIKSSLASNILPPHIRPVVLFICCCIPFYSFATGKNNAYKIVSNSEYWHLDIDTKTFKYIGYLNGKTFLTDIHNNKILIIQDGEIEKLTFQKHKKP
jgi:uncharacterized membrane protein